MKEKKWEKREREFYQFESKVQNICFSFRFFYSRKESAQAVGEALK